MRVDVARYFWIHCYGGVYVDLDFECRYALDPLLHGRQLLFGQEPPSHIENLKSKAKHTGIDVPSPVLGNAFIGSVPKHPFWEQVFSLLQERAFEEDPLYATGPLLLSEAWRRFKDKPKNALLPSVQLYPISAEEALLGDTTELVLKKEKNSKLRVYAVHHWMGSWIKGSNTRRGLEYLIRNSHQGVYRQLQQLWRMAYIVLRSIKSILTRIRLRLRKRIALPMDTVPSRTLIQKELKQNILVAVPVKNATQFLPKFFRNLARISYPRQYLHLAFLESDSDDDTWGWLQTHAPRLRKIYGSVQLYQEHFQYKVAGARYHTQAQLTRRSILARSRNRLLELALRNQAWVLWVDVDVEWWPPHVIECLLAEDKPIIAPNCVTPYGACFDLNSFKFSGTVTEQGWSKYIVDGLIQPPVGVGRHYLNDFHGMGCVPLDAVGGTMLLVKAEVHKKGIVFPERPYKFYIETEGFAVHAADQGFSIWGMPDLKIIHPVC